MNKKQILTTSAILGATVLISTACVVNRESKDDVITNKAEVEIQEELKQPISKDEELANNDLLSSNENTTTNSSTEQSQTSTSTNETTENKIEVNNSNNSAVKPSTKPNNSTSNNSNNTKPPTSDGNSNNDDAVKPSTKPDDTTTNPPVSNGNGNNDNTVTHPPVEDGTGNDNIGVTPETPSLVINNDSLTNGEIALANNTFKDIYVDVSISDAKVVLDNVNIQGKLILQNGHGYTVDVNNSSVKNIKLQDSITTFATGALDTKEDITLTLTNVTDLQTIDVNGDININGNTKIPTLNIEGGNVIVDVLADTVTINKDANSVDLTINKDTNKIDNNGTSSSIKANSNITTLNSNGNNSSVYIKEDATIKNAIINGDSEKIMGNGTLEYATVNGSNVGIFTDTKQENITIADSASNPTIGKEETIKIESINLKKQGTISFTLNQATPLTLDDVSIICHGGKSMTILDMTTTDNKTYTLSTAYYKDNTYELYLTLPNNKVISKEFLYSYNHPTASEVVTNRVSETNATLDIYDVDEGGYLYYTLVEKTNTRNSLNITKEYLKENGTKVNLVVGYNEVTISNLNPNKQYDVYYMMEAFDGRISPVYDGISIGEYKAPSQEAYALESVEEVEMNKIVFKFNQVVNGLTIDDFKIVCPKNQPITIDKATLTQSDDGKTWTMVIPQNYQHADNKYTVTVNMPDGTQVQGSFVAHFNYPTISGETLTRPSEDTLKFEFNSDEKGTVYYGLYEWNGEYNTNSNNPKADDVLNNKVDGTQKSELVAGKNALNINMSGYTVTNKTRIWVLYVDYANNYRTGFTDYHKVPQYVPPVVEPEVPETPEVETTLEISNVSLYEGWTGTGMDVYFNEDLNTSVGQSDVTLESISGMTLPSNIGKDIWWQPTIGANLVTIELRNVTLTAGDYKITIQTYDSNGNLVKVSKVFTVS